MMAAQQQDGPTDQDPVNEVDRRNVAAPETQQRQTGGMGPSPGQTPANDQPQSNETHHRQLRPWSAAEVLAEAEASCLGQEERGNTRRQQQCPDNNRLSRSAAAVSRLQHTRAANHAYKRVDDPGEQGEVDVVSATPEGIHAGGTAPAPKQRRNHGDAAASIAHTHRAGR